MKDTMKNPSIAFFAVAACALSAAYGQDGTTEKQCFKRCMDILPATDLKKADYDYEAVNNDAGTTDAQKKKSHKKAVANACTKICSP